MTALMMAAAIGDSKRVRWLLKHKKIDVEKTETQPYGMHEIVII